MPSSRCYSAQTRSKLAARNRRVSRRLQQTVIADCCCHSQIPFARAGADESAAHTSSRVAWRACCWQAPARCAPLRVYWRSLFARAARRHTFALMGAAAIVAFPRESLGQSWQQKKSSTHWPRVAAAAALGVCDVLCVTRTRCARARARWMRRSACRLAALGQGLRASSSSMRLHTVWTTWCRDDCFSVESEDVPKSQNSLTFERVLPPKVANRLRLARSDSN